jgi:hypothetical protein
MNKRRADPLTWSVVSGDVTAGTVDESDGACNCSIALFAVAYLLEYTRTLLLCAVAQY